MIINYPQLIFGAVKWLSPHFFEQVALIAAEGRPKYLNVTALFIDPGSPSENSHVEYFFWKLRGELFNAGKLDTL